MRQKNAATMAVPEENGAAVADDAPAPRERGGSACLIATKFRAPTYANDLVRRGALIERLDAARQRRLALIRAPAGYGKTTLAVQWRDRLLAEGLTTVWLSLDEDDNDLVRFLSYLIEGLGSADPRLAQDLISALEARSRDAAKFVLGDLVNAIAERSDDVYVLLDDWHLIRHEPIQEALLFLITHAPDNLHLLITTRMQPPWPLARLRVEGQVVEIEADDLRFDVTESREFLEEINALRLPADALELLWRTTDGWIAALQLASLSLRGSEDPAEAIRAFSGQHRVIGDYLAENVLNNLPETTLLFLMRTSILDRLSGPLCAAVTGADDSQRVLEQLERQDLFIRPLDEQRQWFRYHHLFAAHLRRRLERDRPGEVEGLQRAACEWFAAEGHTSEAVGHALAAGAIDRAVELVDRDAMWLVEHSRMATLIGLADRLPTRRLVDRPTLQMALAWAHCLTHHPEAAQNALTCLEASLDRVDAAEHRALEAEARLVQGTVDIYADRIERVGALVGTCIEQPDVLRPWIVAVAANVLTYVRIHSFQFEEARALQLWARRYHDRTLGPFSGVYGRCFAGMAAAEQGRLRTASDCFRDALALARETAGGHSHAARLAGALWGQVQYEYDELAHAEQLLEESRSLGAEGGVADFSLATYLPLARIRARTGDIAGAHALLDEGVDTARQLGIERIEAAVDAERVRLYLADGDVCLAERLLRQTPMPAAEASGIDWLTWEARELSRARVECARGRLEAAIERLETLLAQARRQGRGRAEVVLRVALACCFDAAGQRERARNCLMAGLDLGAGEGMVRTFLDEGAGLVALLERTRDAVRQGEIDVADHVVQHLGRLIAAARVGERTAANGAACPEGEAAGLVEPLKPRELQMVRLLGKGCSNKEIARNLGVEVNTVKWYLKSVYAKLCVHRRTEAVAEAKRLGLLGE